MTATDLLLYVVSIAIWGSTWFVIKFQLGVVHPAVSVGYRFMVAGLLLAAFARFVRHERFRLTRRQHLLIAIQSLFLFCLNYVSLYLASQWLKSGIVAVLFSTMVIFNGVGSRLFFGERLPGRFWAGAVVGVLGIALIFSGDLGGLTFTGNSAFAIGLTLAGTLSASIGNLISSKLYRDGIGVLPSTTFGMLYGGSYVLIACAIAGLPFRFDASFAYLASMTYLALFGSIVAFLSFLTLLRSIGPARASYTSILTPLVALTLSSLFEGLPWSGSMIGGVTLCVLGNLLVIRRNRTGVSATPVSVEVLKKSA